MKLLIEERGDNLAVFCATCREYLETLSWHETLEGVFCYSKATTHECELNDE